MLIMGIPDKGMQVYGTSYAVRLATTTSVNVLGYICTLLWVCFLFI